jgi:hypothetical protein
MAEISTGLSVALSCLVYIKLSYFSGSFSEKSVIFNCSKYFSDFMEAGPLAYLPVTQNGG